MGVRLLKSPAYILAEYIIEVLGDMADPPSTTWPLYRNSLPDGNGVPDNAGAVFDTSPLVDGRYMSGGVVVEHPGVQLRVRSKDQQTGYAKIEDLVRTLETVTNVTVSTATETFVLQNVSRSSGVVSMGIDEQRRWHHTANFLLTVKETAN